MRKLCFAFIASLIVFTSITVPVSAQTGTDTQPSCSDLVWRAESTNTDMYFRASGCAVSDDYSYYLKIFDSSGTHVFTVQLDRILNQSYLNTYPFVTHSAEIYRAELFARNTSRATNPEINLGLSVDFAPTPQEDEDTEEPEAASPVVLNCTTENGTDGFPTAIGCLSFEDANFLTIMLVTVGIGIAGGIALIIIAIASFMIMTSQGDPRRLQSGQELFMSAMAGLIMILLTTLIMRLFGQSILGLF